MVDNIIQLVRLNAVPSKLDSRDFTYKYTNKSIPNSISLKEYDSNIENQGNIGSCVANAITSGYEVLVKILYPQNFVELSRLFVYYHSRLFSDNLEQDMGSYIRDGLKSINNYGVCSEELWPYLTSNFSKQPIPQCYLDATKRKITSYNILYTNDEIKEVLASKQPVVLGCEIFTDFKNVSKENPYLPMPEMFTYSLGGHAVLLMGYDDNTEYFLAKNSYGKNWGDDGYVYIPYDYVSIHGFERWCFEISNQSTNLS